MLYLKPEDASINSFTTCERCIVNISHEIESAKYLEVAEP